MVSTVIKLTPGVSQRLPEEFIQNFMVYNEVETTDRRRGYSFFPKIGATESIIAKQNSGLRLRKKYPGEEINLRGEKSSQKELQKRMINSWPDRLASHITSGEVKWLNVIVLFIIHASGLYGILFTIVEYSFSHLVIGLFFGIIGGLGVTAGAHRYYTHRSFKATLPLQIFLLICYTIAGQNTIYDWVRDHRLHHKFSETEADPHNSKRGFFFSHVGWLMVRKTKEVKKKGSKIDMSDITSDPLVALHTRFLVPLQAFLCFGLPISLAIITGNTLQSAIFINMFRYMLSLNFTWSVNSFAHIYGNKPYDKRMAAAQNWLVSLVAVGEGWHNYHHAFPWDYRASEFGNSNLTKVLIDSFAHIGWAYGLKTATDTLIDHMSINHGDGTRMKDQVTN